MAKPRRSSFSHIRVGIERVLDVPALRQQLLSEQRRKRDSRRDRSWPSGDLRALALTSASIANVVREWPLAECEERGVRLQDQIGGGAYGRVHRARLLSTGAACAVKIVELEADDEGGFAREVVEREVASLRSCAACPQILQASIAASAESVEILLVMELCEHGSVADVMRKLNGPLTEDETRLTVREVLQGLEYLHRVGKVHGELKSGNILLTKDFQPKLSDIGLSRLPLRYSPDPRRVADPVYWMAPELIKGHAPVSELTDVWALTITAIEMAEGQTPYNHMPGHKAIFVISESPPKGLRRPQAFSEELSNFLGEGLTVNPGKRPSAKALLTHPFLQCLGEMAAGQASQDLCASLWPRLRKEEFRRRARAWVDRIVPMETLDGDLGFADASGQFRAKHVAQMGGS